MIHCCVTKTHDPLDWETFCEDRSRSAFSWHHRFNNNSRETKEEDFENWKQVIFLYFQQTSRETMIGRVSTFFRQHPMVKGMAVYSVIWPTSSVVQQLITKEDLDWRKSLRFFLFGTFFVAPTLYGWIKLTSAMWPQMSVKTGIAKAVVEQFTYGPMAGVSFFTLMTLMEGKSFDEACTEVREKFPRTYKGEKGF